MAHLAILALTPPPIANPAIDYHAIAPELVLAGTIFVVLLVDLAMPLERKWYAMVIAFLGVLGSLAATLTLIGSHRVTFGGSYVVDNFAILFKVFFTAVALAVLLLSLQYVRESRLYQVEYYFLMLASVLGMLTMPSSRDLLMLFISLDLVSAPAFILVAFRKTDPRSNEAGLKFFLIGVLSTAVMLYGMSLVYGITGSTRLSVIALRLSGPVGSSNLALAAILFVVAGFAFKVSAFPFQFWAPDTYEGAPVPIAAFLAVASKAAGFAGLLQPLFLVSLAGLPPTAGLWGKFYIFRAAIDRGGFGPWLAVAMVVNSVISLVYYLYIVKAMFLEPIAEPVRPLRTTASVTAVVLLATAGVIVIGVLPSLFAHFPPLS